MACEGCIDAPERIGVRHGGKRVRAPGTLRPQGLLLSYHSIHEGHSARGRHSNTISIRGCLITRRCRGAIDCALRDRWGFGRDQSRPYRMLTVPCRFPDILLARWCQLQTFRPRCRGGAGAPPQPRNKKGLRCCRHACFFSCDLRHTAGQSAHPIGVRVTACSHGRNIAVTCGC